MNNCIDTLNELQILARYNRWANGLVYDSVNTLSDNDYRKDQGAFFGSVFATLNHLLLADHLWTSRIIGEYHGLTGLDQILHEDFANLQTARNAMDEHIIRLTDRYSVGLDGGLDKEIRYRSLMGGERHSSLARHVFLTMFNHQTHHRGQVHCMLTQSGVKAVPGLDVIFFIRESLPE